MSFDCLDNYMLIKGIAKDWPAAAVRYNIKSTQGRNFQLSTAYESHSSILSLVLSFSARVPRRVFSPAITTPHKNNNTHTEEKKNLFIKIDYWVKRKWIIHEWRVYRWESIDKSWTIFRKQRDGIISGTLCVLRRIDKTLDYFLLSIFDKKTKITSSRFLDRFVVAIFISISSCWFFFLNFYSRLVSLWLDVRKRWRIWRIRVILPDIRRRGWQEKEKKWNEWNKSLICRPPIRPTRIERSFIKVRR